jgi:hypothetical protein
MTYLSQTTGYAFLTAKEIKTFRRAQNGFLGTKTF